MLKGIGVSPGIGLAPAIVYRVQELVIPQGPGAGAEAETAAFFAARDEVIAETERLIESARANIGESEAAIFEAHAMILQDEGLSDPVVAAIQQGENAASAVATGMDAVIEMFDSMDDDYMRERAADMRDIRARLLGQLLGAKRRDLSALGGMSVIIAHDLTPSDTAKLDKQHIAGIITEVGGRTSHTAIMARAMEVPAIVGCVGALKSIEEGAFVAMDGETGTIALGLSDAELAVYREKAEAFARQKVELSRFATVPSMTKDGREVEIAANIGTPEEAAHAAAVGADAVGLFRSEFMYMDRNDLPNEEEQFNAYREAVSVMGDKPVIVRTLDVGGDKKLPALPLPEEENPFLGYRAIRICLDRPDVFKVQLRALLRASAFGPLKIMFPMISSMDELRAAKAVLQECKDELTAEGIAFAPGIQVGIMIEIPAAVLIAPALARECDFFSIGTNDLIQYTVAVDRGNEKITALYSQYHPGVLRLVQMTIAAAHEAGIPCGMCGEAGGDPLLIPLLLGMGLDEFSMSAGSVLAARKLITELDYAACRTFVSAVLRPDVTTAAEVVDKLRAFYA